MTDWLNEIKKFNDKAIDTSERHTEKCTDYNDNLFPTRIDIECICDEEVTN